MALRVESRGETHQGLAVGVDRKHLKRLQAGAIPAQWELDLHGLSAKEARIDLQRTLVAAHAEGVRCVLVIHGRGSHSELGPVLKKELPAWLDAPPLGRLVMAFASARSQDGGSGASYVLLRRRRSGGQGLG